MHDIESIVAASTSLTGAVRLALIKRGGRFTTEDLDTLEQTYAPFFPAVRTTESGQTGTLRCMTQRLRDAGLVVFEGNGVYRFVQPSNPPKRKRSYNMKSHANDVPSARAKATRDLFRFPEFYAWAAARGFAGAELDRVPVRFSTKARYVEFEPEDYDHAEQLNTGKGNPFERTGCAGHCALINHADTPSVWGRRHTACLEETSRGKLQISIYSTGHKPAKFDKGERPAGIWTLNPYPQSWRPENKRIYAKRRAAKKARGKLKPRKYKFSGKYTMTPKEAAALREQPF